MLPPINTFSKNTERKLRFMYFTHMYVLNMNTTKTMIETYILQNLFWKSEPHTVG